MGGNYPPTTPIADRVGGNCPPTTPKPDLGAVTIPPLLPNQTSWVVTISTLPSNLLHIKPGLLKLRIANGERPLASLVGTYEMHLNLHSMGKLLGIKCIMGMKSQYW